MWKVSFMAAIIAFNVSLEASCCIAQTDAGGKLRLLTYGMPHFEKQNAERVVADRWGIEFYAVAGCTVSEALTDSVDNHNAVVEAVLVKRHGKGWWDKFYKEVEVEYELEKSVTQLVDQLDFIRTKQAAMKTEGNGLYYTMNPVPNSTKYTVAIEGWGKVKAQHTWVTFYTMLVDYRTSEVALETSSNTD